MTLKNGLRGTDGQVAAPPYTKESYTWDSDLVFSGTLTFSGALTVEDLTVEGSFTFGDVAADDLTIIGHISTEDAKDAKFIETGTYQSTASSGITLSSTNTRPVSFLHDDAGVLLGAADYRAVLSRVLLTIDQSNAITLNSMRGHIKALDGIDISSASSVVAPVQGYIELAGTSARTVAGHIAGVRSAIEEGASGATTISGSSYYSGFEATLNSTRTYTETGKMAGLIVNISGGTSVWPKGIYIDSDATTTGMEIGNCTTGIIISGTSTDAIKITGTPTTSDITLHNGATLMNTNATTLTITEAQITLVGSSGIKLDGTVTFDDDGTIADAANVMTITQDTITLVGAIKLDGGLTFDDDGTLTDVSDVMTITQDTIALAGATAITLTGPTTITGTIKLDGAITLDDDATLTDVSDVTTLTQDTITLVGATAINLNGVTNFSSTANHGTFASPTTIVKDVPLVMFSSDLVADQADGVSRSAWFRTKVSIAQSGIASVIGIEAQCRINDAATLAAGQFTGSWNYFEQSGTTALSTGCLASGSSNTVETASTFTIDSGAILAGVVVDSSVNAGITNNGTFDAIYIKKAGGALDFVSGIEFTDCVSGEMFKFADDGAIVSVTNGSILNDISATANAGFIKVMIGSTTRYIAVYAAKS